MVSAPRPAERPKDTRTYTITELAQEFDVTPRAIRFYEDVGLLTPERAGRNRVYTLRDRTRLKLTLRGKRLGLSLQEIKRLVDMYESPSDTEQQLGFLKLKLGIFILFAYWTVQYPIEQYKLQFFTFSDASDLACLRQNEQRAL